MHLYVRDPEGRIQHMDTDQVAGWSLELAAGYNPGPDGWPTTVASIGVALRYASGGQPLTQWIAKLDCVLHATVVNNAYAHPAFSISHRGLPYFEDREANKQRLQEGVKSLINAATDSRETNAVQDAIQECPGLVDVYYDVEDCLRRRVEGGGRYGRADRPGWVWVMVPDDRSWSWPALHDG